MARIIVVKKPVGTNNETNIFSQLLTRLFLLAIPTTVAKIVVYKSINHKGIKMTK
jgi:hypothetical protein